MSGNMLNKFLLVVGFTSFLHSAYSAAQYRTFLRITEQESGQLPLDIVLQTLISLVVVLYNVIQVVGDFKEIRAAVELQGKTWETMSNIPSYYMFNHRGKALAPDYVPPSLSGKADLSAAD